MKKTVSEIAAKGRFGDDALLHVSTTELQGLAALSPTGELTINPDTGLPEAFFFLPFLFGAAAPAAAGAAAAAAPALAATAAAPAMAGLGALGTGLGAGMTAATGALGSAAGLGSLAATAAPTALTAAAPALASAAPTALTAAAPLASAAPTLASAAPTLASAAPTAASALPAATTLPGALAPSQAAIGSTIEAAHAAGAALPATGPMGVLPPSVNAIPGSAASSALAPNPASLVGQSVLTPSNPIAATATPQVGDLAAGIGPEPFVGTPIEPSGLGTVVPDVPMTGNVYGTGPMTGEFPAAPGAETVAAEQGGIGGLMGSLGNIDLMKLAPLAMMMPRGGGGGKKKGSKKDMGDYKYEGGDPIFPDDDYRGGIDPEWRYFPLGFARGGTVTAGGDVEPMRLARIPGRPTPVPDRNTTPDRLPVQPMPRPTPAPDIRDIFRPDPRPRDDYGNPRPEPRLPGDPPPRYSVGDRDFNPYENGGNSPNAVAGLTGIASLAGASGLDTTLPVTPKPDTTLPVTPRPDGLPVMPPGYKEPYVTPEISKLPVMPPDYAEPKPTIDRPYPVAPTPGIDGLPVMPPGYKEPKATKDPIIGDWGPGGGTVPGDGGVVGDWGPGGGQAPETPIGDWGPGGGQAPTPTIDRPYAASGTTATGPNINPNYAYAGNIKTDWGWNKPQSTETGESNTASSGFNVGNWASPQQQSPASQNTNFGQWGWGQQQQFAEGGLATIGDNLMEGAGGGIGMLMGGAPEPVATEDDEMLIEAAVRALQGQVENPDQILSLFVQTFGEQALQELIASVQGGPSPAPTGGLTAGPGDGMSDSIPTSIDGAVPAALSTGEFVIPADVVSGLGNGSTDAGAAELEGMMGRVRQMRHGGAVQPPRIDPKGALPA
jgi:hypothetical protein